MLVSDRGRYRLQCDGAPSIQVVAIGQIGPAAPHPTMALCSAAPPAIAAGPVHYARSIRPDQLRQLALLAERAQ